MPALASAAALGAPPGALISNQAQVSYDNASGNVTVVRSNDVVLRTGVVRSPSTLLFTRIVTSGQFQEPVGPAACQRGGAFEPLSLSAADGSVFDPAAVRELAPTSAYNLGETLFLRLNDSDQNVDFAVVDTAVVSVSHPQSGDAETIRLSETGPDTGVFAGFLPSSSDPAVSGDCVLQGTTGAQVQAAYTDPADTLDSSSVVAVTDPVGRVFDSRTGQPIDGALVRLVDATTGLPATVFGSDGISQFPAEIVSGATQTDSGGTTYAFSDGEFRFPVVPPGNYRFDVDPPGSYAGPSNVATDSLQLLPNAPFALGPESFSNVFTYDGNGPFAFDYPVDPQESTLFVQKTTRTTLAAPGDFVRYDVRVANTSATDAALDARIVDVLPQGMRFVEGSVTREMQGIADPIINDDHSRLTFELGDLAADTSTTVSYVLEIVTGERNAEMANLAFAEAEGDVVSNESIARIRLREDLFRSTSTLIGRVVEGSCARDSFAEDMGVAGVRVYLEDGRYAVTDEGGRFHFEGLDPGTHVVQMDTVSVPEYFDVVGCANQARFAGGADSQFVDLSRGALQRADFYLQRKLPPEGRINISLESTGTDSSEVVAYELRLNGTGNISISNLRSTVMFPDGMRYRPGTLKVGGASVGRPRVMGQSITLELDDKHGLWNEVVTFEATIEEDVSGNLVTRAIARFETPADDNQQTPVAETLLQRQAAAWDNEGYVLNLQFGVLSAALSAQDRQALDALIESWRGVTDIRLSAVGHSDSSRISARNRDKFADNYVLSEARAAAAADYLAAALAIPVSSVQVEGRGPDQPVASNDTEAGRAMNRRVELILGGQRPVRQSFLKVTQPSSGTLISETRGLPPGIAASTQRMIDEKAMAEHLTAPVQLEPHINSHKPGVEWVLPRDDYQPPIPAVSISVKHELDQTVALFANGLEVSPLNFEGTEVNTERNVAVSRWTGVDLLEGSNPLVADIIGANGLVAERLTREVHYAGTAVRAELLAESSVLIADGRTRPLVAVQLFDRFGRPARHSSVGAFSVDAPYRSMWAVQNDRENKIVHVNNREPVYSVGDNGVAYIELEPTTQSGLATVRLRLENQREQEMSVYLKPQPRDWIMVGFGEGTVGYNTLKKNAEAATRAGQEEGYYDEGRVAFFAKGQIKGEYLLTLAYDSAKKRREERLGFQTEINPNEYYTLYADNTEQRFEAPSQRKLYVKLERNQFVALFGDYSTGLSTTELSRYERRFNGLKSEFYGANLGYTVFAAESNQSFVRDELQGDGTSGLYRLSSSPVLANSETIRLETRDRFDSALVLETRTLTRFLDYNLDPFDGSLYFKTPVPSRDSEFNPIFIVVEYETSAGGADDLTAGGRVAAYNANRTLEVGFSHISEDRSLQSGDLSAVDLRWQLAGATQLRMEYATSNTENSGTRDSGVAELVSVEHRSNNLDLRASYKEVDQSFGLGQQSAAESGIRKYAVDGRYAVNTQVSLTAQAAMLENLETGTERTLAETTVEFRSERTTASIGVTHAEDAFLDGAQQTSNVISAGISRRMSDSALTARANGTLGVGDEPENADYLASYVVGFDYTVRPEVDVFIEYENASGKDIDTEMTRVGVRASPWSRAQINSSLNNEMSEFGPRLFANLGLIQGFQINERWVFDLGFDQTRTVSESGQPTFDDDRERAFGSFRDDFAAGYVGTLYQSDLWSVNSRLEYRNSDREERATLLAGWYRERRQGQGMSAGLTVFQSERDDGSEALSAELRFGWAYRRADSPWSLLNRVDLQFEDLTTASADDETWRVINNLNANRRISANTQLALQYAFKYVSTTRGGTDLNGYTDLVGVDFRRGFGRRWEASVNTSAYHSYRSSVIDYGLGLELGYNLTDSMWLSVGYNFAGFHDDDFAAARYTAQGPFMTLTVRAHQDLLRRVTGRQGAP